MDSEKYYREKLIPTDWKLVKLEDILILKNGTRPKLTDDGHYPVYGANGIMGYSNNFLTDKEYTLIFGRVGASGNVHLAKGKVWVSDNAIYSDEYKEHAYPPFLFYMLTFKNLKQYATKTTHPIITQSFLKSFKISLPPLPEQRRIAKVLSTVDESIEKTEREIEHTERLKKGLMQRLLTRDIGHTEFRESEISRIPKEWEVVRLGEVAVEIKNGFASGKRDENGVVQLRMNNITTDGRIVLDKYLKVPIPKNVDEYILQEGDFLFNNTNSYDLVGKSAIFKGAPFPCVFSNHFTRIRFNKNRVVPEYIGYYFIRLWEKGYFKSVAIRHVGQAAVGTKYIINLKIPLPPLPEQRQIVEILGSVDSRLELLRERRERLERVKKGLMNDLLTGRKRVPEGVV